MQKCLEIRIRIELKNGFNSKHELASQFLWYIKKYLPESMGGFSNKIKYQINLAKK